MLAKTKVNKIGEILLGAVNIIDKDGWWDGKGDIPEQVDGEPACLMLAIARSSKSIAPTNILLCDCLYRKAVTHIKEKLSDADPIKWNDSHSKDEVTDLLRTVAYEKCVAK